MAQIYDQSMTYRPDVSKRFSSKCFNVANFTEINVIVSSNLWILHGVYPPVQQMACC